MKSRGAKCVLLVEDDRDHVLLIERAFRKAEIGCVLRLATNGEEAIAYLEGTGGFADRAEHPLPDLVLLDLKLPRRGGLDVLRWVRGRGDGDDLPVVVLTTSDEPDDVRRAYRAGANSYVVKPGTPGSMTGLARALGEFWLVHHRRARS